MDTPDMRVDPGCNKVGPGPLRLPAVLAFTCGTRRQYTAPVGYSYTTRRNTRCGARCLYAYDQCFWPEHAVADGHGAKREPKPCRSPVHIVIIFPRAVAARLASHKARRAAPRH